MFQYVAVAFIFAVTLTGCGNFEVSQIDSKKLNQLSLQPSPTPDPSATPDPNATPAPTPVPGTKPVLVGTWKQACTTADSSSTKEMTSVYTASTAVHTVKGYYGSTNCTNLTAVAELTNTYVIGTQSTTPSDGWKLDSMLTKLTITPSSSSAAFAMNFASICGLTNWASGVTQDVTGKTCQGFALTNGAVDYSIVKVVGTSLSIGMLGNAGTATDGTSDTKRPITYDPVPFVKQ